MLDQSILPLSLSLSLSHTVTPPPTEESVALLASLPPEVLALIFCELLVPGSPIESARSLVRVGSVCRSWHHAASAPEIWRALVLEFTEYVSLSLSLSHSLFESVFETHTLTRCIELMVDWNWDAVCSRQHNVDVPSQFMSEEFMMRVGGMKRYFILMQRWIYRTNPNNSRPYNLSSKSKRSLAERALKATAIGGLYAAGAGGIMSTYELATLELECSFMHLVLPHSLAMAGWLAETDLSFGDPF